MKLKLRDKLLYTRREEGGLMVEIIIVMVILGVSIIPLTELSISNLEHSADYMAITESTLYAEEIIEDILADYDGGRGYDDVVNNWGGSVSGGPTGLSATVSVGGQNSINGIETRTVSVMVTSSNANMGATNLSVVITQ